MINVNYWCEFIDHPKQPKDFLIKPPPKGTFTSFQIKRAAVLISNMLNFNDMLNKYISFCYKYSQTLPPSNVFCMNQYKKIFGTTRIPGEKCDSLVHQYPTTSKHIIVLARDMIYKVQVLGENNARVGLKEIERQLFSVGEKSLESTSTLATPPHPIGVLTAGNRDNWFKAHQHLKSLSDTNIENFNVIDTALFAVCLDDKGNRKNNDDSHLLIFHNLNAQNRWFDKAIQIIVSSSGRAGLNGEVNPFI